MQGKPVNQWHDYHDEFDGWVISSIGIYTVGLVIGIAIGVFGTLIVQAVSH